MLSFWWSGKLYIYLFLVKQFPSVQCSMCSNFHWRQTLSGTFHLPINFLAFCSAARGKSGQEAEIPWKWRNSEEQPQFLLGKAVWDDAIWCILNMMIMILQLKMKEKLIVENPLKSSSLSRKVFAALAGSPRRVVCTKDILVLVKYENEVTVSFMNWILSFISDQFSWR